MSKCASGQKNFTVDDIACQIDYSIVKLNYLLIGKMIYFYFRNILNVMNGFNLLN